MLKIKRSNTTIVLQEDSKTMSCTRLITNRIYLIVTRCDGTTISFTTKCNKLFGLDDKLFVLFDSIRRDDLSEEP